MGPSSSPTPEEVIQRPQDGGGGPSCGSRAIVGWVAQHRAWGGDRCGGGGSVMEVYLQTAGVTVQQPH